MRMLLMVALPLMAVAAWAQVPAGWTPFVIGEIAPDSVCNVSAYNPEPAGARGFISIRDGHFYDGAGKRLRFLATNCTFQTAFPDKEQAPAIAARMAALGINCVRFHHMDCHPRPRGIWDPSFKDRQHLDAEQLDRLDWFIYQLKQKGIYCNLNLHVSRTLTEADGVPNPPGLQNYDKGVDNFSARMIELQHNYARDLLTHVNAYTKKAYVEEPCVAMVEFNNENSLLGYGLSGSYLYDLPEPYRGELHDQWIAYLKQGYKDTAALRRAWDEGSEPLGQELLRNQDLSAGTREWTLESRHPGTDVFEVVSDPEAGKALHARLVELGQNLWDFQIHQVGHDLKAGQLYTLSFKIRAVPDREVHVGARYDVADWRSIGLQDKVRATGQWREYSFCFRATDPKPQHNRLSFDAQNYLGDVWLAQVSLKPGGLRGLPETEQLEAGRISLPTTASTAAARRDWLSFLIETERRYTVGLRDYVKGELKLHAPVIDTQASYGGLGGALRESRLDYADNHAYWQHPNFPGKPWDGNNWRIGNSSMVAVPGSDTLTGLALYRLAGKPYTISEYNHPAPSDYRAEAMPMVGAFAALQDWDGVFQFDYGSTPADWTTARVQGYFQMVTDPAFVAFFPVAANLLRRGDVQPARGELRLRVPVEAATEALARSGTNTAAIWKEAGVTREAALSRRLALQLVPGTGRITATPAPAPAEGPLVSDTGEIRWLGGKDSNYFTINTPKTRAVVGKVAGQTWDLGGLKLQLGPTSTGYASVAVTAMDDLPLERSRRLLVVAAARVENQGMNWSEDRRTVGNKWGNGPTIVEQVPLQVTLAGRRLQGFALDGSGRRAGAADPAALSAPTLWYELTPAQ